jgi:malonyl-CoA O-methyltransferase
MTDAHDFHIDKRRVRNAFDRAAANYDRVAVLQREVGTRLLERLDYIRLQPYIIADIGAGTGHLSKTLAQRYKKARVIATDIAPNMLRNARRHAAPLARLLRRQSFVCGDAERLPFAAQSVDIIFSNLTLQWCSDLDQVFAEFCRILKPGGLALFSTFGPDTLKELRDSWAEADQSISSHRPPLSPRERARGEGALIQGASPQNRNETSPGKMAGTIHVGAFIDMHDIGDALLRGGFADPVMDAERFTLTYPDVYGVMNELKALGAHNAAAGRPRTLTGKGRLQAMRSAYERYRIEGVLPATFEVVYGLAWAPAVATLNTREEGVVKVSLSALQRHAPGRKS